MPLNGVINTPDNGKIGQTVRIKKVADYDNTGEGRPLEWEFADVIPAPTTAEVGQVMRVAAVDANGKPTAWEPYSEGEYELIQTITVEEDTMSITVTEEPDGTPWSFRKIVIKVAGKAGATKDTAIIYEFNDLEYRTVGSKHCSTEDVFASVDVWLENGVWNGYTTIGQTSRHNIQGMYYNQYASVMAKEKTNYIYKLHIRTNNTNGIYKGTTFEIWAVRA